MSANKAELTEVLADVELTIEKAVRLGLTTAVYLLRMTALDLRKTIYGEGAECPPEQARKPG